MEANSIGVGAKRRSKSRKSKNVKRKNKKCISCQGPRNDLQEISDAQQKRCSALLEKICALQLDILSSHLVRQYDTYLEKADSFSRLGESSRDNLTPSSQQPGSCPSASCSSSSSSSSSSATSTTTTTTATSTAPATATCTSSNTTTATTATTTTTTTPLVVDEESKMIWREGSSTSDLSVLHKIIEKIEFGSSGPDNSSEDKYETFEKIRELESFDKIHVADRPEGSKSELAAEEQVLRNGGSPLEGNSDIDPREKELTDKVVESYSDKLAEEATWLTDNMNRVLRETMQLSKDWDETDSSCGDESCDEEIAPRSNESETLKLPYLPFLKNPSASWALARAAAITSWLWNHDAIAHVSFRLEQQDQVHRHLKTTKPTFQLEDKPLPGVMNPNVGIGTSLLQNAYIQVYTPHVPADSQKSPKPSYPNGHRLMESPIWSEPRAVKPNVLKDQIVLGSSYPIKSESEKVHSVDKKPYGIAKNHTHPVNCDRLKNIGGGLESLGIKVRQESDVSCTARRCLPLKPYRPRKIFQLGGVHKMAFQPSKKPTIMCECFGRKELCASCTGRLQKIKSVDGDFDDFKDLTGILDDSHHQSLGIIEEKPLPLIVDASLASEGWDKVTNIVTDFIGEPLTEMEEASSRQAEPIKRRRRRPKPEFVNTRPTTSGTTTTPRGSNSKYKRRKFSSVSSDIGEDSNQSELSDEDEDYSYLFENGIPSPSCKYSKRGSGLGQDGYRRKRDEKYDIDNIVIPYSIASTTRVEKIEYKEIITPSWRLLPNGYGKAAGKNGICTNGWDEEIEDLSMEVIQARHERSEVEEHRKFNRNPKKSHRRSRRIDSKADYSDSNTPDPMSPNPEGNDNYLCSPGSHSPSIHTDRPELSMLMPPSPATMLAPVVTEAVAALAVSALKMHSMGPGRRRTMSSTNSATSIDEDDDRRTTVVPWEKRSFPLPEDEYQRMRTEMPDEYLKLCDEDEMFWKEEIHS